MTRDGFPHSGILGCACQTANRGLSQSCHALLRLLDPRHPPQTLSNLTHIWAHSQIALLFLRTGFSCIRCAPVFGRFRRPPPALGSTPAPKRAGLPSQPTMFNYRGGERRRQAFFRGKWKLAKIPSSQRHPTEIKRELRTTNPLSIWGLQGQVCDPGSAGVPPAVAALARVSPSS